MTAPACSRCGSDNTVCLRSHGKPVEGRFQCLACVRWFGPHNPPDAGGTGEPEPAQCPHGFAHPASVCREYLDHGPAEEPSLDEDIFDGIETAREIGKVTDFVALLEELQRRRDADKAREAEREKAVAEEREACAACCDEQMGRWTNGDTALRVAAQCIRMRSL